MPDPKRSAAAKRGWKTRRRNMQDKKNTTSVQQPASFKWFADKGMNQIYSSGLEFAFVSPDNEQCHPFAFCKDYLQDAVWAYLHKSRAAIYGFTYKYGKNPKLDMTQTRMAVRFKGQANFGEMCLRALSFMQELEKAMGFELSQLTHAGTYKDSKHDVFVFISDRQWMYSPVLVSLYSLAIRVGLTFEGGDWRSHFENAKSYTGRNDRSYTGQAKKALDKIIGKKPEKVFAAKMEDNYPKGVSMGGLHDYSGIVSFAQNNVPATVKKNWVG